MPLTQVELWRADLCTSVILIDREGRMVTPEHEEVAQLYPPDLILGLPPAALVDQHIGKALPALTGRPLSDLFVAGSLGSLPEAGTAAAGGKQEPKRSAMKSYAGKPSLLTHHHRLCCKLSKILSSPVSHFQHWPVGCSEQAPLGAALLDATSSYARRPCKLPYTTIMQLLLGVVHQCRHKRSACKVCKPASVHAAPAAKVACPVHLMTTMQHGDQADMQITLQASRHCPQMHAVGPCGRWHSKHSNRQERA